MNPTTYTPELGDLIVEKLWEGMTLPQMRRKHPEVPSRQRIHIWKKAHPDFGERCNEAMKEGAWALVDETRDIVDNLDECPNSRKLRAWQRLEEAKRKNHALGDRHVLAGDPEAPLQNVSEQQLDERIEALLAKAIP